MRTIPSASQAPSRPLVLWCFVLLSTPLAGLPLAAQAAPAPARPAMGSIAITHVTVIDVATGASLADRTVLLRDRHIATVDTAPRVRVPAGTRQVDGTGRFLIPGLWDMHTHLAGDRIARTSTFALFIANGVTGVRDMWGDCDSICARDERDVFRPVPAAVVQRWKSDIAGGTLIGPRIVESSAMFEGPTPMFPGSYAIRSPEEARAKVRLARQRGVDFIKVLPNLPRDSYLAIMDESKRVGLPVAGHVPFGMTVREVSDAGQRSIEHLEDVLGLGPYARADCSSQPDSLRAAFMAMVANRDTSSAQRARLQKAYRRVLVDRFSTALCDSAFAHLARNGTWRVPTLAVHVHGPRARLGDKSILSDARLQYVDARIRQSWLREPPTAPPRTAEDSAEIRAVTHLALTMPAAMRRSGVLLLAGTDEPNPWVIPGFSLHDELALFVEGGLTPLEALQAATINPARFLQATDSLGTIAAGKLADLVVLDADPLADIHNTTRVAFVIVEGRVFDRPALDQLLADAARTVGAPAR